MLRGMKAGQPDVPTPCVSVVMAVFNEEARVAKAVEAILAQPCVREIIAVDDCSRDRSWEILQALGRQEARLKLFRQEVNQGKGAALRLGFQHATSEIVLVQDADLEYDPADYPRLIHPILAGRADVVFGSRFAGMGEHRVLYFWHSVGNRLLTLLSNAASNLNLTDMETCYKVFRRDVLARVTIEEARFGFEPEITAKVARMGVRIYEVPISYYGRTYAEGKKAAWRDGCRALWCILRYNFFSRK
jgi:glycosyltransferase involved in cell wall biosynthesis